MWILLGRREAPPGNPSPAASTSPAGSTSAETAAASLAGSGLNDPVTAPPTAAPVAGVPSAAVPPAPPRPRSGPASTGPAAPAEATPRPADVVPSPPLLVPVAVVPAYSPPAAISEVLSCREGVEFHTDPEEAVVSIDGQRIGVADDWDGMGGGKAWQSQPGTYVACMSGPSLQTVCVEIHLEPGARKRLCDVDTDLEEVE